MKRISKTAVVTSLFICLVLGLFMSSCVKNKKEMDQITSEKFEPELKKYAIKCCNEKYGADPDNNWRGLINGWEIKKCERRGTINLQDKDDRTGKIGSGTFHMTLEPFGPRKFLVGDGSVDVYVTGEYIIGSDKTLSYVNGTEYDFKNEDLPKLKDFLGASPMEIDSLEIDSLEINNMN